MRRTSTGYVETESLTMIHRLAVLLVLLTGGIHVYAGLVEGRIPVLLAGIGFLGAIVLFLLAYYRSHLYLAGIVYTAVQFPLWYVAKASEYTMLGYVDKTLQVLLIVVLAYLHQKGRETPQRDQEATSA